MNANLYSLAIYNPPPIRLCTKPWPNNRSRPFTEFWEVFMKHIRRVLHADRDALGPVPSKTYICSTFWINILWCTLVQLLYYILKCIHFEWSWLLGPFRYMLTQAVRFIVWIISIPDEEFFSETTVGCTASFFVKSILCSRWFCPHLFWGCVLLNLRSPKGGSCSISDDLSCSCWDQSFSWTFRTMYFEQPWYFLDLAHISSHAILDVYLRKPR